ncbi:MAG: cell division protein ZapC [Succinivibrio sp.]|nr:cell division protein ZapC [Succinivibrio sp.]
MKFTPLNDWKWSYKDGKLIMLLRSDEGKLFSFTTHYRRVDLMLEPEDGQKFCVADANLLTDYQEGLYTLNLSEGGCLDLGINAVACERYVRPSSPVSNLFVPMGAGYRFGRGSIVSLYSKQGNIGDCLVINENDQDNLMRLMLLNVEFKANRDFVFTLGSMLRVRADLACPYRAMGTQWSVRYA